MYLFLLSFMQRFSCLWHPLVPTTLFLHFKVNFEIHSFQVFNKTSQTFKCVDEHFCCCQDYNETEKEESENGFERSLLPTLFIALDATVSLRRTQIPNNYYYDRLFERTKKAFFHLADTNERKRISSQLVET